MKAFEDGDRVHYKGVEGLISVWQGKEGVVTDSYRDFDGNRTSVLFDGETKSISVDEDDLVAVKATYEIENHAEDSTSMTIALTDREAALLRMVMEGLNVGKPDYAPTLEMKRADIE